MNVTEAAATRRQYPHGVELPRDGQESAVTSWQIDVWQVPEPELPPPPFSEVVLILQRNLGAPNLPESTFYDAVVSFPGSLKAAKPEDVIGVFRGDSEGQRSLGYALGQLEIAAQNGDESVLRGLVRAGMEEETAEHLRVFGMLIAPLDKELLAFGKDGAPIVDRIHSGYLQAYDGPPAQPKIR